jgi:hypothetical protein
MTIFLDSTLSLQVVTSAAGDIDITAPYMDASGSPLATTGGGVGKANATTATTTTLIAAPSSGVLRSIREVSIYNAHASVSNTITVQLFDGTNPYIQEKVVLAPGEKLDHIEGMGWMPINADGSFKQATGRLLFKALAADDTGGQNVLTAQPWFPTAGGVLLAGATTYKMEGRIINTRAAGAGSHTTSLLFGGTATLTSIDYDITWRTGDANAAAATNGPLRATSAAAVAFKAASTATTEDIDAEIEGIVRVNAGGTFIPQFQYNTTVPGGAPTAKRGQRFLMWPIGDNNAVSQGTWA